MPVINVEFLLSSGKILKKFGYGYTFTFCFVSYALRLGLISFAPTPWWVLPIEFLQGPTYALCYTTIVAYASAVSPPGTSATVQGIVAGMDDGFGKNSSFSYTSNCFVIKIALQKYEFIFSQLIKILEIYILYFFRICAW